MTITVPSDSRLLGTRFHQQWFASFVTCAVFSCRAALWATNGGHGVIGR